MRPMSHQGVLQGAPSESPVMSKFQTPCPVLLRLGSARRLTRAGGGSMFREPHNPLLTYDLP